MATTNITLTPEELDAQGKDLIQFASDLSDILKSVDAKVEEINAGWKGLAQDAYFNMYGEMKTSLEKFPEMVEGLGNATVAAAEAFSQVDETLQGSFNGQG